MGSFLFCCWVVVLADEASQSHSLLSTLMDESPTTSQFARTYGIRALLNLLGDFCTRTAHWRTHESHRSVSSHVVVEQVWLLTVIPDTETSALFTYFQFSPAIGLHVTGITKWGTSRRTRQIP